MNEGNNGIVYVLTNPAMPDLVKIGITTRDKVDDRIKELFTTSVPVPFDCEFACKVNDCSKVEKALQVAFGPNRIHPAREFFSIEPEQAIAVLKLISVEDVTPQVVKEIELEMDPQDAESSKRLKIKRRPPLNFEDMGIPIGSVLKYRDDNIDVVVTSTRKVMYNDEEVSLTKATRIIQGNEYDIQPTPFWFYNGVCLTEIYNKTYVDVSDSI